jgi:hypothetical protein
MFHSEGETVVATARSASPIFIIGTERSGSNLLRLVLNAHSRIAVPHPPHFMRYLAPIAPAYGDLTVTANRRALTRDALTLLARHIHPWPALPDVAGIVADASPTLFGIVAAVYERYRVSVGKSRWGCKSTFMGDYADDVLAEYADARFVWLVRDPLDVAASAKRSVFGPCHPLLMARLWRAQQERAGELARRLGPETVHLMRYEDLVSTPERQITRLCEFLGERVEPAMLCHHRSREAGYTASLSESWRNVGEPISARRVGGHQDGLTERERHYVLRATAPVAERLGYRAAEPGPARMPSPLAMAVRSAVLRSRVELASLRQDRNHRRRLSRDATVRWLRLKALVRRGTGARRRAAGIGATGMELG